MKWHSHDSRTEYHPGSIGLTSAGGPTDGEILVWGKGEDGEAIAKALETVLNHGAKILSISSYINKARKNFQLLLFCDLSEIDIPLDGLIIKIRKIKSVSDAQLKSMKGRMFSSQVFPLTLGGGYRTVALGSHLIVELDRRLSDALGGKASDIVSEEGRQFGLEMIELSRMNLPEKSPKEPILENVKAALKAAGWGDFNFMVEGSMGHSTVIDPPTLNEDLEEGVSFLGGIAEAVCEFMLDGRRMSVESTSYNKPSRILTMNLVEKKAVQEERRREPQEKEEPKVIAPLPVTQPVVSEPVAQVVIKPVVKREMKPKAEAQKEIKLQQNEELIAKSVSKATADLQREKDALKEIDSIIFSLDRATPDETPKKEVRKHRVNVEQEEETAAEL